MCLSNLLGLLSNSHWLQMDWHQLILPDPSDFSTGWFRTGWDNLKLNCGKIWSTLSNSIQYSTVYLFFTKIIILILLIWNWYGNFRTAYRAATVPFTLLLEYISHSAEIFLEHSLRKSAVKETLSHLTSVLEKHISMRYYENKHEIHWNNKEWKYKLILGTGERKPSIAKFHFRYLNVQLKQFCLHFLPLFRVDIT